MSKAGELNWDHLMKTGSTEQDPLAKSIEDAYNPTRGSVKGANKGGDKVTKEELLKEAADIVKQAHLGGSRQLTDQEMFGHLVPTEEQVQKADKDWEGKFNNHFGGLDKPVDDQSAKENQNWGSRGSVMDELSEEERIKWNMTDASD